MSKTGFFRWYYAFHHLIGGILIVVKSKVNHVAPPLKFISFLETRVFMLVELDVVTSNRRLHVTCSLLHVATAFVFFECSIQLADVDIS